jgi:predicted nucleic acid-binding protein
MELLKQLISEAWIPSAVFRELVLQGGGWTEAKEAREEALAGDWLSRIDIHQAGIALVGNSRLDDGEREVISLALGRKLTPIIDESLGRREADRLGLVPIGTLGLLALAKERKLIPNLGPVILEMKSRGLRFGDPLISDFLARLGERWPP